MLILFSPHSHACSDKEICKTDEGQQTIFSPAAVWPCVMWDYSQLLIVHVGVLKRWPRTVAPAWTSVSMSHTPGKSLVLQVATLGDSRAAGVGEVVVLAVGA